MESKSEQTWLERGHYSFEHELLQSLSLILRNVSEFLSFYEQSLRPESEALQAGNEWSATEALSLTFTCTLLTWTLGNYVLNSGFITTWAEVVLSWLLFLILLPLTLPLLLLILLGRTLVGILIRAQHGGKVWLADPFDAVWSFEKPASTSTCVGLYVIEGKGDLEKVRRLLYTRVMLKEVNGEKIYDRFRWCLRKFYGFVCWERLDHFVLKDHLDFFSTRSRRRPDPEKLWTEDDLFQELAELQDVSLDLKDRSPWEILLVPNFDYRGGEAGKKYYAIVFRIHHSLMDGVSMGNILHSAIADRPFKFSVDPTHPLKVSRLTIVLAHFLSFLMLPHLTLRNLFFIERNAFHGPTLEGPKTFLWSRPIRLDLVKELKNRSKTSVFTVLLACLAGSMRSLYLQRKEKVPDVIHACPPVAILPYPDRKPRNRFSVVLYPLAIGKGSLLERLEAVFRSSMKLASSPNVLTNFYIVYILGLLPFPLLQILAPLAHATLTFSNIPGPTERVEVLEGDKLAEIGAWIPIKNKIGIGMALFSYEDRLRVTFIGDRASLPNPGDVHALRDGFEAELSQLSETLGFGHDKLFISS